MEESPRKGVCDSIETCLSYQKVTFCVTVFYKHTFVLEIALGWVLKSNPCGNIIIVGIASAVFCLSLGHTGLKKHWGLFLPIIIKTLKCKPHCKLDFQCTVLYNNNICERLWILENETILSQLVYLLCLGYSITMWQQGQERVCCNGRDPSSIPGSGRPRGEGNGNPPQYLAWKISWTEELGRLQPMGLQRVAHDWVTSLKLTERQFQG